MSMRDLTITEAEALHGGRLDRRCRYATPEDGVPCMLSGSLVYGIARWSEACSGCYEGYCQDRDRGHGCSECGYTGRSRREHWVPIPPEAKRAAQAKEGAE